VGDARDFHLPDLPNAGYATTREKQLSDATMQFMRDVERHRLRLLSIVIEGREVWRRRAQSIWRGLKIGEDHQLLDTMFSYFELQSVPPAMQRQLLDAQRNPAKWRDLMTDAMPDLEREREHLKLVAKWQP
jgi:hypothetical protein